MSSITFSLREQFKLCIKLLSYFVLISIKHANLQQDALAGKWSSLQKVKFTRSWEGLFLVFWTCSQDWSLEYFFFQYAGQDKCFAPILSRSTEVITRSVKPQEIASHLFLSVIITLHFKQNYWFLVTSFSKVGNIERINSN